MSCSMASVEIGSSAEHGSSISSTSGSMAIARAMQRRCCCPPERPDPGRPRRSLTSSHRLAPRSARSTSVSASSFFSRLLLSFLPASTLS